MFAECLNGRRCVAYDPAARRSLLRPVDGPLCPGCLNRAAADIADLPGDYGALNAELPASGPPAASGFVSGGDTDAPVPLALAIEALQRDIVWALTVWEPPVREAARLSAPRPGPVRDWWAVAAAVRTIAPRVDLLARLEPTWGYADGLDAGPVLRDGVYALEQLRHLHVRALAAAGQRCVTRSQPGPCPGCGRFALQRDDGSDVIYCAACRRTWTAEQYRKCVGLLEAGQPV